MIYFHANAEDIGEVYEMLDKLRSNLRINVLAPEYPGYGIYTETKPFDRKSTSTQSISCSAEQIKEDADSIYDFVLENFTGIQESDILLLGRSMGSGPSIYLSSTRNPGGLVCMSAYTSIKNVVYDSLSFLNYLVPEQFDNLDQI